MNGSIKLSVIIPTLNSGNTISLTLSSLCHSNINNKDFEIIIVDGGSIDKTLDIVSNYPCKVLFSKKKGAAIQRNIGIKESKGEIICFTDSDCVIKDDWLTRIIDFFNEYPDVDGVGGKLLPNDTENKFQKAVGQVFLEMMNFPKSLVFTKPLVFNGTPITANLAVKREIIIENLFDETFFTSAEDIDLCWSLLKNGKLLVFYPDLVVYHIFPKTIKGLFFQYFKYGIGSTKLQAKYFGKGTIDWFLIKLFFKSLISTIRFSNNNRLLDATRCLEIIFHISGKIAGSFKEKIINI
jgi:glycosyltransferase involved in cell wall biosynthesis